MSSVIISFGDNVRIRETKRTLELGVANRVGSVYGGTTPSSTGVDVVGDLNEDFALNVFFEETKSDFWFSPELLEFIDHGAGLTITLKGIEKKWTRTQDGEWVESEDD